MDLEVQIQSVFVSVIIGMISSTFYNIFYFLINNRNLLLKVLSNIIYSFIVFTMFFYVLFLVNNGIVHIYFIMLFIFGFVVGNINMKKIRIDLKKSN